MPPFYLLAALFAFYLTFLDAPIRAGESAAVGIQHDVVFDSYSPLVTGEELARRMLTPLVYASLLEREASTHRPLSDRPIELSKEKFVVYVPAEAPADGYTLVVFIPPWSSAMVPANWIRSFDRNGVIFVSAAGSGNDAPVIDRRIPLALLAAHNIMQRYSINRERVYAAGMSGGSRVALRMALAYPEVFRGALLNAGSDLIGETLAPPDSALFAQFQDTARLIYVTGDEDRVNLQNDAESRLSMRRWCVFGTGVERMPRAGHDLMPADVLDRALRSLTRAAAADQSQLAACRAQVSNQLTTQLRQVDELIDRSRLLQARSSLERIDARYGGMALPDSLALAQRIDAHR